MSEFNDVSTTNTEQIKAPEPPEINERHQMTLEAVQELHAQHGIETHSLKEWDGDSVPDKPYFDDKPEDGESFQFADDFDEETFNKAYDEVNQPIEESIAEQKAAWVESENDDRMEIGMPPIEQTESWAAVDDINDDELQDETPEDIENTEETEEIEDATDDDENSAEDKIHDFLMNSPVSDFFNKGSDVVEEIAKGSAGKLADSVVKIAGGESKFGVISDVAKATYNYLDVKFPKV